VPAIRDPQVGVALDMHGCPNRCRHCWLGQAAGKRMSEDDLRWIVAQFRGFTRAGEDRPLWSQVRVSSWVREPDYADGYRRLYELENELSGLPSLRAGYELLSIWRLARDPEYAEWAHGIGLRVCQLSFFGMEKVTDWGHRRRGAFRDLLVATERLLGAGIRPRWQVFLTKALLPDLPGLLALAEELRLRPRCEALGGPFTFWMHTPSPDGEAWRLERLRPTADDLAKVPGWFRAQSEERHGGSLGEPEGKLVRALREERRPIATCVADLVLPNLLWFHVTPEFDVYPSIFEASPAYCLGNLRQDGLAHIVDVFENDRAPGLQAVFHVPVCELARRYGRPRGRRLYDPGDVKTRWAKMWVEEALQTTRTGQ